MCDLVGSWVQPQELEREVGRDRRQLQERVQQPEAFRTWADWLDWACPIWGCWEAVEQEEAGFRSSDDAADASEPASTADDARPLVQPHLHESGECCCFTRQSSVDIRLFGLVTSVSASMIL